MENKGKDEDKDEVKFCPMGVILDMDGLMLETEKPLISVWINAGRHFGREIKEETVLAAIGNTGDFVRQLCARDLGEDFPYDEFHKELNRMANLEFDKGIVPKIGLDVFMDHLLSRNIPCAVATSTRRKWALWKLEKAGVSYSFSVMVCGDDVSRKKPAPDIYLAAAEKLGLAVSECVGFEDSIAGLQSLNAAGMRSVFIKDLVDPPEELLSTVWRRYDNLAQAAELFK